MTLAMEMVKDRQFGTALETFYQALTASYPQVWVKGGDPGRLAVDHVLHAVCCIASFETQFSDFS